MPRISGPELRPDWIGTGSAAGEPGLLAGSIAIEPMDRSERPKDRSSMVGRVPDVRQRRCPWGEVRLRCKPGAAGVWSSRVRGGVRPFGDVWRCRGQRLGLAGLGRFARSGGLDWIGGGADGAFGRTERSVIDGGLWAWLARLVWRWIKTVIPGGAERSPGIHDPLKETGFPPSRE